MEALKVLRKCMDQSHLSVSTSTLDKVLIHGILVLYLVYGVYVTFNNISVIS